MKTSNKLLLTAIIITIISMVAYDFALRAEYIKGTYKSRFYEKKKLAFKGFKSIDNHAANFIEINIERGDQFGVWISNADKNKLKFTQNGDQLTVDLKDRKNLLPHNYNSITIICPVIEKVNNKALITVQESPENYNTDANTTISGFEQQNLNLVTDEETHIGLNNNKIQNLEATVGNQTSKTARLFIGSTNVIGKATIHVYGKNELNIQNPKIDKAIFTIADSANVNLGGSILKLLSAHR